MTELMMSSRNWGEYIRKKVNLHNFPYSCLLREKKTPSFEILDIYLMDYWIKMLMHESKVQFQLHNVLSWDENRIALKRNQATFDYKYFLEHLYTAANNILKGFSKDHKGDTITIFCWIQFCIPLQIILANPCVHDNTNQNSCCFIHCTTNRDLLQSVLTTRVVRLTHRGNWAREQLDSVSQITAPCLLSTAESETAFCIRLYRSLWNQIHINHHFTNLSFLNTAVHTWPDDSSPEHLAAPTAASSSSWIIDTALESAQVPTWAHRQFGQTGHHALVMTPLAQHVLDNLK